VGVDTAADQACLGAPERTHAAHFAAALRAMVDMLAFDVTWRCERKRMATFLAGQSKIGASEAPFGSVRIDETAGIARVGDEMRQFVEKRAGQFLGKSEQARIEQNHRAIEPRQTRGGAQPRVPMQRDTRGQVRKLEARSPRARLILQLPQHFRRMRGAGLQGAGGHDALNGVVERIALRRLADHAHLRLLAINERVWRNAVHQENVAADRRIAADDRFAAEHGGVRVDRDIVLDVGMALAAFFDAKLRAPSVTPW